MKTALILAYDFPPYVSVGGLRPYSWYKYFREFGIYPVVVTRQWKNEYGNGLDYIAPSESKEVIVEKTQQGTIIRTPYKPNWANRLLLKYGEKRFRLFRKIISGYYELMQWFFFVGPKAELYKAANKYLSENKVDVIIATGEPFILFRYASVLSKKYGIPWLADYRDPWSQNAFRSPNFFLRKLNGYMEKRYVKTASRIITVSDFCKKQIKILLPGKKYEIIINGYDPEILQMAESEKSDTNNLVISYAGTVYDWHPLESFLKQCVTFVKKNQINNFRVNFYGINKEKWLKEMITKKYKELEAVVFIHSRLPNHILAKELAKSHVLLLFNDYSIAGTKIYDYLAVKRKILFCYSQDEKALLLKKKYYNLPDNLSSNEHLQEDIIKETRSGIIVKNEAHLVEVLDALYLEFQETGKVVCSSKNTSLYSRRNQVEKLAILIKEIR